MTVLFTIPRLFVPNQTLTIPSSSIPTGITRLQATVNRFAWPGTPSDVVATVQLEFSLDNGATWPMGVSATLPGGATPYKGNPDPPSSISFPVPEPSNTQRRVRGTLIVAAPLPALGLDTSAVVEGF